MASELTAHVLVKFNQTDPVAQRVLVREGEYYHTTFGKWLTLPDAWQDKAREALDAAARATVCE